MYLQPPSKNKLAWDVVVARVVSSIGAAASRISVEATRGKYSRGGEIKKERKGKERKGKERKGKKEGGCERVESVASDSRRHGGAGATRRRLPQVRESAGTEEKEKEEEIKKKPMDKKKAAWGKGCRMRGKKKNVL